MVVSDAKRPVRFVSVLDEMRRSARSRRAPGTRPDAYSQDSLARAIVSSSLQQQERASAGHYSDSSFANMSMSVGLSALSTFALSTSSTPHMQTSITSDLRNSDSTTRTLRHYTRKRSAASTPSRPRSSSSLGLGAREREETASYKRPATAASTHTQASTGTSSPSSTLWDISAFSANGGTATTAQARALSAELGGSGRGNLWAKRMKNQQAYLSQCDSDEASLSAISLRKHLCMCLCVRVCVCMCVCVHVRVRARAYVC